MGGDWGEIENVRGKRGFIYSLTLPTQLNGKYIINRIYLQ